MFCRSRHKYTAMSLSPVPTGHKRRHSWPAFKVHVFHHPPKDINENPFVFFLSAPDEPDEVLDDITAGIENVPRSRSLSPLLLPTHGEERLFMSTESTSLAKLKKWIARMERRYFHHTHLLPPQEPVTPLLLAPPSSPGSPQSRGRSHSRGNLNGSRDTAIRSHSGKPRVWREPSEDIWPVLEEHEDLGLGISA